MLQRISSWSTRKKIIAGGIVAFALLVFIMAIAGSEESTQQRSEPTTTNPPTPAPLVSAQMLWDEREANATRFDDQRKGAVVRVQGRIVKIDNNQVSLGIDPTGMGLGIDEWGLSSVVLKGLSREQQASLDKGMTMTATCKVGDFILGSMMMEDCRY